MSTFIGRNPNPPEVTTLVVLYLVAAVMCTLGALLPPTDASPALANGMLAVVGWFGVGVLWTFAHRLRRWCLHLGVTVYLVGATVLVASAATGEGAVSVALAYVWTCLYAAVFLGRRSARRYASSASVALAIGLYLSLPTTSAMFAGALVAMSIVVATEVASRVHDGLRNVAVTDQLTGTLNRVGLGLAGDRTLLDTRRRGTPMTVAVIDLDGFKAVNDRAGHAAGDRMLARLTTTWREQLRGTDVIARYGGDEFVLLLPDTDRAEAEALLDRLLVASPVAWSSGIATARPTEELAATIQRADERMYAARLERRLPAKVSRVDAG